MNKLTFQRVWNDAFQAGHDQAIAQIGADPPPAMNPVDRNAVFEAWFKAKQEEAI